MPGLLVAAGADDAAETVRRAAGPLLRQPWETLSVLAVPDGRVALGFAGERGAVTADGDDLVAFDGELFGAPGVRTGEAAARELLALYRSVGAGLDPPEGTFAAALWDGTARRLVLIVDRYGDRNLFVARDGGTLLAAGELKALVAAGIEPQLDLQAWAETLAYGHVVGDRSPLEGVRVLPGATTLVVENGGVRETCRWRYRLRPEEGDDRELAEEFGRLLELAVESRLDGREALAFSSGLDSRSIALVLSHRGFGGEAVTWALRGAREGRVARTVAQRAGLRHRLLELERGYAARRAPATVWLAEGRKHCLRSQPLAFRMLRREDGVRAILLGTRGDDAIRLERAPAAGSGAAAFAAAMHAHRAKSLPDRLLGEVLSPGFAKLLQGRAEAALTDVLAADEGDRDALLAQLRFRNLATLTLVIDHLAPRDVLSSHALVDFCARLPYRLRLGGELERAYLRSDPRIARVRTPESYAPAWTGRAERAAAIASLGALHVHRAVSPLLPVRLRTDFRRSVHDSLAPRTAGAALLGILLEPRTLARGQLRPEGVRRVVDAALGGEWRALLPARSLLGLELFQRQFADGDGDPGMPSGL